MDMCVSVQVCAVEAGDRQVGIFVLTFFYLCEVSLDSEFAMFGEFS